VAYLPLSPTTNSAVDPLPGGRAGTIGAGHAKCKGAGRERQRCDVRHS
jgi:hypothetical protein